MRIFGVILAGGAGRRMGGADKALLTLGGVPLARLVHDRIAPQVEALAFSANGEPGRLAGLGCPVLPDARSLGPLSGILAALDWAAAAGGTAVASAAVDTPFCPEDLVPRLVLAAQASRGGVARAASGGQRHPTFGLWPVALRADLRATLARGAARVTDFADRHGATTADFADDRAFLNLNTPEDLARAEALLRAAR